MNTFKLDDNALRDLYGLALGSLTEDKSQPSTSVSSTNTSSASEYKVSNAKEMQIRYKYFNLLIIVCEDL